MVTQQKYFVIQISSAKITPIDAGCLSRQPVNYSRNDTHLQRLQECHTHLSLITVAPFHRLGWRSAVSPLHDGPTTYAYPPHGHAGVFSLIRCRAYSSFPPPPANAASPLARPKRKQVKMDVSLSPSQIAVFIQSLPSAQIVRTRAKDAMTTDPVRDV